MTSGCYFEGCPEKHYARGLCLNHWLQLRKGQELHPLRRKRSMEDRFWDRVDMRGPDECWPWKMTPHKQGYGTFCSGGKGLKAHRVSYELTHHVTLGDSDIIDHKCRNRICVNPSHLHLVTHKQNTENIGLYKNNPSGYRGVTPRENGKWRARGGHNGRVITVGQFDTPEEANEAVLKARLELHTNNLIDRKAIS